MSNTKGRFFLFVLFIINALAIFAVPYENIFIDKESVIKREMTNATEVDVADLKATGVLVCMTDTNEPIVGYEDPNWFHKMVYTYAQFYILPGSEEPILIADDFIEIPETGSISLDLTKIETANWSKVEEPLNQVCDSYGLSTNDYIDNASAYCNEISSFRSKKITVTIIAVIVEGLLVIIISVILAARRAKNKKEKPGE